MHFRANGCQEAVAQAGAASCKRRSEITERKGLFSRGQQLRQGLFQCGAVSDWRQCALQIGECGSAFALQAFDGLGGIARVACALAL